MWNSLPNCFLCHVQHILKILLKCIQPVKWLTIMGPEKREKSCFQQDPQNVSFRLILCVISAISCKIMKIYSSIIFKILLTGMTPRLVWWPWNSLVELETVSQLFCCVISNISWKFHENPFTRFPQCCSNVASWYGCPAPPPHHPKKLQNSCMKRGKWNIPQMLQDVPFTKSHLSWMPTSKHDLLHSTFLRSLICKG